MVGPLRYTSAMLRRLSLLSMIAAGVASTLAAAPIAINIGDFVAPTTTISFDSIGNGVEITNQFAGLGVTFAGGLFGNTVNTGFFTTPGTAVAGDFNPTGAACSACNAITLTFSIPIIRIGMQVVTDNIDDFRITVPGGSLDYVTNLALPEEFAGLQDLSGFSTVTLQGFGTGSHAFLINDLIFEPVPEPSTWGLVLIGFVAIALARRRFAVARV